LLAGVDAAGQGALWDARGVTHTPWLDGPAPLATALAVSPDERMLAVGDADGGARFLDLRARLPWARLHWQASPITGLGFSPDGKTVAVATREGMVYQLGPPVRHGPDALRPSLAPCGALAYSPDGKVLAVADRDRTIKLIGTGSGQVLATLEGHLNETDALAFAPDGRTLASLGRQETTVRLWDATTGKCKRRLKNAGSGGLAFSPAGPLLAVGSDGGTVRLWDAWTGSARGTLHGRNPRVLALAFSLDGRTLVSAGSAKTVDLWDLSGGRAPAAPSISHPLDSPVSCVAFLPDGRTLVTGEEGGWARFWQRTGKALLPVRRPLRCKGPLTGLGASKDGRTLLTLARYDHAELWDVGTLSPSYSLHLAGAEGRPQAALSPAGDRLAALNRDGALQFLDARAGQARTPAGQPLWAVRSLAFTPDGKALLTGSEAPRGVVRSILVSWPLRLGRGVDDTAVLQDVAATVRAWDASTGRDQGGLTKLSSMAPPSVVALAPDGRTLAAGGLDGSVLLWDRATGRLLTRLFVSPQAKGFAELVEAARTVWGKLPPRYPESVRSLAFSPDGRLFVTASSRGAVRVWGTAGWREVCAFAGDPWPAGWATFSPRGELVTGSGGQVQFRDPHTGKVRFPPLGAKEDWPVACTAFMGKGKGEVLAVAHKDHRIRLWDLEKRRQKGELIGHQDQVAALAFSPDRKTLASASHDRTVKLWSVAAAAEVASLEAHGGKVHCLAFSPDGTTLASGGEAAEGRGEVYLWRAPPP
jgi:WD40 repeat protein